MFDGHKVCTNCTRVRTLVRTFVRILVRTMACTDLVRTMPAAHVQWMVFKPMNGTRCAQAAHFT